MRLRTRAGATAFAACAAAGGSHALAVTHTITRAASIITDKTAP